MARHTGAVLKTYCGSDCTMKVVMERSTAATTMSAMALPMALSLGSSSTRQMRSRRGRRVPSGTAGAGDAGEVVGEGAPGAGGDGADSPASGRLESAAALRLRMPSEPRRD